MTFATTFALYCLIFLVWEGWSLSNNQVVEMIFMGTFLSVFYVLLEKPLTRLTQRIVKKILS